MGVAVNPMATIYLRKVRVSSCSRKIPLDAPQPLVYISVMTHKEYAEQAAQECFDAGEGDYVDFSVWCDSAINRYRQIEESRLALSLDEAARIEVEMAAAFWAHASKLKLGVAGH